MSKQGPGKKLCNIISRYICRHITTVAVIDSLVSQEGRKAQLLQPLQLHPRERGRGGGGGGGRGGRRRGEGEEEGGGGGRRGEGGGGREEGRGRNIIITVTGFYNADMSAQPAFLNMADRSVTYKK